jgi:hypothetical protein
MLTAPTGETPVQSDTWQGCYATGWPRDLLVEQAYSHPAKFSYKLIERIYTHARAEGWLPPGAVVLDPFAGVALGALHCLKLGCAWVGNELEPKFQQIACANLEKWMAEYRALPGFGPWAMVTLGDSRQLTQLLPGQLGCCISSPPYADGCVHDTGQSPRHVRERAGTSFPWGTRAHGDSLTSYGTTPGQLGAMRPGPRPTEGITLVVASPPYAQALSKEHTYADHKKRDKDSHRRIMTEKGIADPYYGTSPGQLGNEPDTFWSASRTILEQVVALLRDGAHAIFVTKRYCRNGQIVDFTADWIALCRSVGLTLLHHHKAMLVEHHGTQGLLCPHRRRWRQRSRRTPGMPQHRVCSLASRCSPSARASFAVCTRRSARTWPSTGRM